jgi:hypothetical protein
VRAPHAGACAAARSQTSCRRWRSP